MIFTVKQQLKHLSKNEYEILRELSHIAKNLYNASLYNVRQHFFQTKKYLGYNKNSSQMKTDPNFKILNSNMAQQIIRQVDFAFKSFFSKLVAKNADEKIRIPQYLDKDGYFVLIIGFVRLKGNILEIPYSRSYKKNHAPIRIKIPPILLDKNIKLIRIIPKANASFFEIQYSYEQQEIQEKLDFNNALAIDLGINNLASGVTNMGKTFIIDGKKLKSINQWYNKQNAKLQSIKDKQKLKQKQTKLQYKIARKRNNKVNDYILKTARYIINYCLQNKIGNIVLGKNEDFQRNSNLGKKNNQKFVNLPLGKISYKLSYLCKIYGIKFVEQEESYTSKASFFDHDILPKYIKEDTKQYKFSGKRIKRGLYKTDTGKIINADINGALNILRKSKVVSLEGLYNRGEVDTPIRIRIA